MIRSRMIFVGLLMAASTVHAERQFFVFDNAFTNGETPEEQALLLRELGYDGICTRPANASPDFLAAFDKHGVKICATYVVLPAAETDLPISVVQHIESLKGRGAIVWLAINRGASDDASAVATIRKVCDVASVNGLEVVLYPHVNFRTDTVRRCEQLRKLANRPELGISFNLCHFLFQNADEELEGILTDVGSNLKLVQLSGANHTPLDKPDMSQLILPLNAGDFDVGRVFRAMDAIEYEGPVGLQCYRIDLPVAEHLKASMSAWRTYSRQP